MLCVTEIQHTSQHTNMISNIKEHHIVDGQISSFRVQILRKLLMLNTDKDWTMTCTLPCLLLTTYYKDVYSMQHEAAIFNEKSMHDGI